MAVTRITKSVSIETDSQKIINLIEKKYGNFSNFVNAKIKDFAAKGA